MTLSGLVQNFSGAMAARFFLGGEYESLCCCCFPIVFDLMLEQSLSMQWREADASSTQSLKPASSPQP